MTTTDTPSVDEARAEETARVLASFALAEMQRALDAYATAVRAEAIRERDEAMALLRELDDLVVCDCILNETFPDRICNSHEAIRTFLSRFPEATEGGEG